MELKCSVSKSSQDICCVSWGSPSPSIKIVDVSPGSSKQPRIVSNDTTDVCSCGHMSTAARCPGSHSTLSRHSRPTDKHEKPLVSWTLESRSRKQQAPVVRDKSQHNCMCLARCVPGWYARQNQDPHWLPWSSIPISWRLKLVKHPALNILAELHSILVIVCQVQVAWFLSSSLCL